MKTSTVCFAAGLFAATWLLPTTARADQLEWVDVDQAVQAQATIAEVAIIRHYCRPCGDEHARAESVHEVEVIPVAGETAFWNVTVNGEAVDLAYVYVPKNGEWRNLALLLGMGATDVPPTIGYNLLKPGHEKAYD